MITKKSVNATSKVSTIQFGTMVLYIVMLVSARKQESMMKYGLLVNRMM